MRYYAFISYSHRDEKFATWLMEAIETYKVPRKLVGTQGRLGEVPRRPFPVFRDRDELVGADLSERITASLAVSGSLVVVCSPTAVASRWVNEEIATFRRLHGRGQVLCIVPPEPRSLEGEKLPLEAPMSVFVPPAVLAHDPGEPAGREIEPVIADARPGKDGTHRALLKVLAGVLGTELDELAQRDLQRAARQRLTQMLAVFLGIVLALAAYVLVADAGVPVPAAEALRRLLDRYGVSVVRAVPSDAVVQAAAREERTRDLTGLKQQWELIRETKADGETELESWGAAQAAAAVLTSPEAPPGQVQAALERVDALFDPRLLRESGGVLYGWEPPRRGYTQAEPALWILSAIGQAHARPQAFSPEALAKLRTRLDYTQRVCDSFHPLAESGWWNMFVQQRKPEEYSLYTTTLALLAMLDLRAGHLGWEGDRARLDTMIRRTCEALQGALDVSANPPGWRIDDAIIDGMTLQIYSELLRAHLEAGVALQPAVLDGATRYLEQLQARPIDFPVQTSRLYRVFKNFDGRETDYTNTVITLWHPWAIAACHEWLRWSGQASPKPAPEEVVAIRRALAHSIVRLLPEARRVEPNPPFYKCSEMLYALSGLERN